MTSKVLAEEKEAAVEALRQNPIYESLFGAEWIEQVLSEEERRQKHPLFWVLRDLPCARRFAGYLQTLQDSCSKYRRIIKSLKTAPDDLSFHSTYTEVEVMAYYFSRADQNYIVEYEPISEGSSSVVDGKLTINGEEHYLEIRTLFDDEEGQRLDQILEGIRDRLDEIEHDFVLSVHLEEGFTEEDIKSLIAFTKEQLESARPEDCPLTLEYPAPEGQRAKVEVRHFDEYGGFVGAMGLYARGIDTRGRIKNALLSKTEQLPDDARNVVIINLSYSLGDFMAVQDVWLGQSCVVVDKRALEATAARHPNGLPQHNKAKKISVVIAYDHGDYEDRRFFLNSRSDKPMSEDDVLNHL